MRAAVQSSTVASGGTAPRGCLPRLCVLAALLAAGPLACSSGGGGGSGGVASHPPSWYETEEYTASRGLGELRASTAYAEGATGEGVTVAVIDTGIDTAHPEFAGALSPASIHIGSGRSDLVQDTDGHGTAVAGVIGARRNGRLGHGVAYEADILAVRADEGNSCETGCVFRESDVARATDHAVEHGAQVINYSLGGDGAISAGLADALARAVTEGAILVLAAGNAGGADPVFPARFATREEAGGQAIAVGALNAEGTIAGFSNRAGAAQEVFLVAPGVGILVPALGGGGKLVNGTSFATAHVSGAAALVLDASPFLSPAEVVAILLESATDLGDPGTDPIYGRGLVNVGAALGPLGELGVPLGERVEGERAPLQESSLALGPAFGPGPALGEAVLLDAYGRSYRFDLRGRVGTREGSLDLLRRLEPAQAARLGGAEFGGGFALRLGMAEDEPRLERNPDFAGDADPRFFLAADLGETTALEVMRGWALGGRFGLVAEPGLAGGMIGADGLFSPYLSLADGGEALALGQELGAGLRLQLGWAHVEPATAAGPDPGARQALIAELTRRFDGGASLSLHVGRLEEGSSLLDSRAEGAFALGEGAGTTFVGTAGRVPLAGEVDVFGQVSYGVTRPGPAAATLVHDVSQLHSMAAALGVGRSNLFTGGDRLTVTLAQPLRVMAGAATIDRPVGRTFEGEIVRQRDRVDLAPAGREIDLELAYLLPLGDDRTLALNWLTQLEPGHDPERSPAHALAVRYRSRF